MLALGHGFLLSGLVVAIVATATGGIDQAFEGTLRPVLAVLLLAGWIGLR